MNKLAVLNLVGLTPSLIGDATPNLRSLVARGRLTTVREVLPAVTCTAQATYLTGERPSEHGIVGNGWYFADTGEVRFWHQSNKLIQRPLLWDIARERDPRFTVANINWWFAMYSTADYTVTPRPQYPADGRKVPDCWTHPSGLRDTLQGTLGTFPLFHYWGPATSVRATRWLASAAIEVDRRHDPTLSLIYLPHLDYNLQRLGPNDPAIARDLRELDAEVGRLVEHFDGVGARIVVLSEYGISPVAQPVHLNRILRQAGLLNIRVENGRELLDAGASRAFAVADHQVAHVYVNDLKAAPAVAEALNGLQGAGGVAHVYWDEDRSEIGLNHPRAGRALVLAQTDAWFTYYYWLDDARAPDFARTVDIHRKPGYDPAELFFDSALRWPKLKVAQTLLRRRLGMRALMDVIGLDATIVRGSHGVPAAAREHRPILVGHPSHTPHTEIEATAVRDVLLAHLFD